MFVFLFIASSSFIHVFVCSIETLHLITHSSVQLLPPCCERGTRYTTSIRVLSLHIQRITTVSLYYVSYSTHPLLNSAKLGTRYKLRHATARTQFIIYFIVQFQSIEELVYTSPLRPVCYRANSAHSMLIMSCRSA